MRKNVPDTSTVILTDQDEQGGTSITISSGINELLDSYLYVIGAFMIDKGLDQCAAIVGGLLAQNNVNHEQLVLKHYQTLTENAALYRSSEVPDTATMMVFDYDAEYNLQITIASSMESQLIKYFLVIGAFILENGLENCAAIVGGLLAQNGVNHQDLVAKHIERLDK